MPESVTSDGRDQALTVFERVEPPVHDAGVFEQSRHDLFQLIRNLQDLADLRVMLRLILQQELNRLFDVHVLLKHAGGCVRNLSHMSIRMRIRTPCGQVGFGSDRIRHVVTPLTP